MRPKQRHPVTKTKLPRVFQTCLLALLFLSSGPATRADPKIQETGKGEGGGEGPSLRASVAVDSLGKVSSTLRFEGAPGLAILGLDIDGDGATLRGALRCGPLVCGPGRLAGPASFLSAPLSPSAISLGGDSFKVDSGLASSLSLLALDLGPVTAFALCRDGGKGFIAEAAGLAGGEAAAGAAGFSLAPQPIAGDSGCATGLVACVKAGGGDLAFMAAASRSGPPGSDGAWRLESAPDPGGLGLVAGLACEARGQGWRSTVGLAYSWGPLRGGAAAARFAGSAILGSLRLSLQAGYAAARFRDCLGEGEDAGAAMALGCGLPLWSGASIRASFRLECPSLDGTWPVGVALRDLIGRSASLALSTEAGGAGPGAGVLLLRSGLSFGVDGDGKAFLSPDLGLSGKAGTQSFGLGLSGRWVQAPGETRASPSLKATLKTATVSSAPFSLEAGHCVSWEDGATPTLDASLGFSLAAFGDGRISFVAEWRKLRLCIAGPGEEAQAPGFSLRYSLKH
jgi:hypothetical protein